MVMLAEYGTLSLAEVLAPSMQMAEGYPIERAQANNMESNKDILAQWESSKRVFLPNMNKDDSQERAAPRSKIARRASPPRANLPHYAD